MRVGCLTTFGNFSSAFSLCGVVKQQLIALVRYGYNPVLFVLDTFKEQDKVPEGVEVRTVIPQLLLEPYAKHDLTKLDEDVAKAQKIMEENMADIDVCLTHDIIFINSYLPYNIALRKAIETKLDKVRWLHWMHSGPSFAKLDGSVYDNLCTLPKNSHLVYMNYTDTLRAAEMYHVLPKDVRTIFNPMDIRELYNFDPITKELIEENDLMSPDFLAIYPLSTTRMGENGKQLGKAIRIMSCLKKKGFSVSLVVPNAHANADKEKAAIEGMYQYAFDRGMERREVIFTSFHHPPAYEHGVPHEVVRDLFLLSNVFLFPSISENCPLVLLEAMAGKNILVLNGSFPAFKDFGKEDALYFGFGSLVEGGREFPDGEEKYYEDIATLIVSEFNQNKAIKAQTRIRKEFNIDYIFKRQLEPAILEISKT